jgi:PTS system mannose-specific IID component
MTMIPPAAGRAAIARSFAVQASWNYETLIGNGFAFTLLPALRSIHGPDGTALEAAIARHARVFNSHPYLVTLAAGAVAKLEADRVAPDVIERFKSAIRGSLGSLGDRLVWSAWRPASLLLGLVVFLVGAPWWAAAAAFLLTHNALHLTLRLWGWKIGSENGLQVAAVLKQSPLRVLGDRAEDAGALLCGAAVVLVLAPGGFGELDLLTVIVVSVGAALGVWMGTTTRRWAGAAAVATWVSGVVLGLVI